jgi:hypothetical protein
VRCSSLVTPRDTRRSVRWRIDVSGVRNSCDTADTKSDCCRASSSSRAVARYSPYAAARMSPMTPTSPPTTSLRRRASEPSTAARPGVIDRTKGSRVSAGVSDSAPAVAASPTSGAPSASKMLTRRSRFFRNGPSCASRSAAVASHSLGDAASPAHTASALPRSVRSTRRPRGGRSPKRHVCQMRIAASVCTIASAGVSAAFHRSSMSR